MINFGEAAMSEIDAGNRQGRLMKRSVSQATSPSCQRYSASLSSDHRSMSRHTAKNPRWFSLS
jgi:hypothetical protein